MAGMNWEQMTSEERLIAEQAILNFRELNKVCDAAADGTVLNVCEKLAMQQGRELIRQTIEVTLNSQAEEVEKKGHRVGRVAESTDGTEAASRES